MPFQHSLSHPLAETGIERRALGVSRHPGTGHAKRRGEVWVVFHGDWTGVWRVDPRDGRTVFLERALDGDRRDEAARWALEAFAIAPPERADTRVLSAANSAGENALEAPRRAAG